MTPQVSIIVPVYNAGAYLAACLDSLLAQTLTAIEILAIDDGSTDQSAAILADYAARDARVVVRTQQNQGVSAARNAGLALAKGDFVGFCDADDWADPTMYGALHQAAIKADAQVAFCAVVKHRAAADEFVPLPFADGEMLDARAIREQLIPNMISLPQDGEDLPISGYTPRNVFRRTLLANLSFRGDIHYAEDLLFIIEALLKAERAVTLAAPLYHYRFHAGATTKRYSAFIPDSLTQSQLALSDALAVHGQLAQNQPRLAIRQRRNILTAIISLCLPGTPFPPMRRIAAIRSILREPDTRRAFADVRLARLSPKLALKYGLIKCRLATPLMVLYSYFYRT